MSSAVIHLELYKQIRPLKTKPKGFYGKQSSVVSRTRVNWNVDHCLAILVQILQNGAVNLSVFAWLSKC